MTAGKFRFFVKTASIQRRLSLFICILLLGIITVFSLASYIGVRKAAMTVGSDRLQSLSKQLGSLFQQSTLNLLHATREIAQSDSVKKFILVRDTGLAAGALRQLAKITSDTNVVFAALLNPGREKLLSTGRKEIGTDISSDPLWKLVTHSSDTAAIGKLYLWKDSIFYPVVATISEKHRVEGYLIRWHRVSATPKALRQLTDLMGSGSALYIGNADGSLWTNMNRPAIRPPIDSPGKTVVTEYIRDGQRVLSAAQPIGNTKWLVLVEFSKDKMIEAANRFLYWLLAIGAVLMITGTAGAWLMSRNITRPLKELTLAASAIATGNYNPSRVKVYRMDEIGSLASAFNIMTVEISQAQQELEKKVKERTAELEAINKELEAFSYSVSHDLRAPLRAIDGYANMLKEEYKSKLDDEANRILNTVILNTHMMGKLIDDLIAFSAMGKKTLLRQEVDMNQLVHSVLHELPGRYQVQVADLPVCYGDRSLLKQVWVNLISNAIKYSARQPEPRIEIGYKEDPDAHIYFVRDNGAGFDMRFVHKLFNVFERLHHQKEFEGTGVGLALVKRIVTKHEGQTSAESELGKGAVFYFSIPKRNVHTG